MLKTQKCKRKYPLKKLLVRAWSNLQLVLDGFITRRAKFSHSTIYFTLTLEFEPEKLVLSLPSDDDSWSDDEGRTLAAQGKRISIGAPSKGSDSLSTPIDKAKKRNSAPAGPPASGSVSSATATQSNPKGTFAFNQKCIVGLFLRVTDALPRQRRKHFVPSLWVIT